MAWLNTAPEPANGKPQTNPQTRRAQIEAAGMEPIVVAPEWGANLMGYLFEFGPVTAAGAFEAGHVRDIEAVLGVEFEPWESRLLIRLSREYQGQQHAATKPGAPCPWPEVAWQFKRAQMLNMERHLDAFCK